MERCFELFTIIMQQMTAGENTRQTKYIFFQMSTSVKAWISMITPKQRASKTVITQQEVDRHGRE